MTDYEFACEMEVLFNMADILHQMIRNLEARKDGNTVLLRTARLRALGTRQALAEAGDIHLIESTGV